MRSRVLGPALLVAVTLAATDASARAGAQGAAASIPPIRPLGRIVRASPESLTFIAAIRVLSDGRVLANDTRGNRVALFDSSLAHFTIVADTTSGTAKAYGSYGAALLPYHGDSSLLADFRSLSFLVIDPAGKLGRAIALPLGGLSMSAYYVADGTVDPQGNVVSKQTPQAAARMGGIPRTPPPRPDPTAPESVEPESTVILRVNIESKKGDTAAWLAAPPQVTAPNGGTGRVILRNPLPVSDAWTVLPDGTIGVIREQDYHIDWVAADGRVTSTPKIAHDWVRITDSMKVAIIDSVRRSDSLVFAGIYARRDSARAHGGGTAGPPSGVIAGATFTGFTDGAGNMVSAFDGTMPQYMNPDELPSYFPPFPNDSLGKGAAMADADGNVWIRAYFARTPEGGAVYDVVNRRGTLIDRVQIPGATKLVGFGPGVAYLISRDGAGYRLARAKIH